jgi:hypothetical protein
VVIDAEDAEMLLVVLLGRLCPFTATKERDRHNASPNPPSSVAASSSSTATPSDTDSTQGPSSSSPSSPLSAMRDDTVTDDDTKGPSSSPRLAASGTGRDTSTARYRDGQRVVLEMAVQSLRDMLGMVGGGVDY